MGQRGSSCHSPSDATFENLTASDDSFSVRVANDFVPFESPISDLCWWGSYLDLTTGEDCSPLPADSFTVAIYDDVAGLPGSLLSSQAVTAVRSTWGPYMGTRTLYQFSTTLPSPVSVSPGDCHWLQITGNAGPDCRWSWASGGRNGNRHGILDWDGDLTYETTDFLDFLDRAFCLGVPIATTDCGFFNGSCCDCQAGGAGTCAPNPCTVPTNDACVSGLTVTDGTTSFDNYCATNDGPTMLACDDGPPVPVGADIWFRYTATCNGQMTAALCNDTSYDSFVAVYASGTATCACPPSATLMDCNDDACLGGASRITVPVELGDCYSIRIGGFAGAQGLGLLDIQCDVVPPPDVVPDSSGEKGRTVSFSVPPSAVATGTAGQVAIEVTLVDLENPLPPNNNPAGPCCPPGNFVGFDTAVNSACAGGNDQGYRCPPSTCPGSTCAAAVGCTEAAGSNAQGSCARWVGPPLGYLESNDNPGLGNYRAARLQCRPYYHDWSAEPNAGLVNVLGAEIVPSSTYQVQVYGASCKGSESTCVAVSNPVTITTRRAGDITTPFQGGPPLTQPNAIDVTNAVNKFRNLAGSPPKVVAQVQPNVPDPNSDINAIDIVTVVDNQRGFGYTYGGPCVCPSTVPCDTTACAGASACTGLYAAGATCIKTCTSGPRTGQPCNNNLNCGGCIGGPPTGNGAAGIPCDANADCASNNCGLGICPTGTTPGFCRDRCGRCN
jgi:hypothetical protein